MCINKTDLKESNLNQTIENIKKQINDGFAIYSYVIVDMVKDDYGINSLEEWFKADEIKNINRIVKAIEEYEESFK